MDEKWRNICKSLKGESKALKKSFNTVTVHIEIDKR